MVLIQYRGPIKRVHSGPPSTPSSGCRADAEDTQQATHGRAGRSTRTHPTLAIRLARCVVKRSSSWCRALQPPVSERRGLSAWPTCSVVFVPRALLPSAAGGQRAPTPLLRCEPTHSRSAGGVDAAGARRGGRRNTCSSGEAASRHPAMTMSLLRHSVMHTLHPLIHTEQEQWRGTHEWPSPRAAIHALCACGLQLRSLCH